jgi:hypothetical protein
MDAKELTKSHKRVDLPIDQLVPNENNPNKMDARSFDLLCDNYAQVGIVDPIFVRPLDEGTYRIVGGHHRWEAAKYLDFETVPCTVITDPNFDGDAETFQVVRMNMIRGKLDPEKFMNMYQSVSDKYEEDLLQDAFGFADDAEFAKLIKQTKKSLPKEMQAEFTQAAKEIKTIDDLSKVLNHLFSTFGDTLDYGYMIFDFNGQENIWLRMKAKDREGFRTLGQMCKANSRSIDDILSAAVQLIANDPTLSERLLSVTKEVDISGLADGVDPTIENMGG